MNSSGSKNRISRRDFLKGIRPRNNESLIINKEKCTGCGLCAMDCQTEALTILQSEKEDTYQLLFRQDLCNSCGNCERSCPEKSLQLERVLEQARIGKTTEIIFEDKISQCIECGTPLFPQAMINRLKLKILGIGDLHWPFDLCPSCRIKTQFERKMVGKSKG